MTARSTSTTFSSKFSQTLLQYVGILIIAVGSIVTSVSAYYDAYDLSTSTFESIDFAASSRKYVNFNHMDARVQVVKSKILEISEKSPKWKIEATPEELEEFLRLAYVHHTDDFTFENLASLIWIESRFKSVAVSNRSAKGLTQIRKSVWRELLGSRFDPFDPYQSVEGSVKILQALKKQHKTKHMAFTRYNGQGPVARQYALDVERLTNILKQA